MREIQKDLRPKIDVLVVVSELCPEEKVLNISVRTPTAVLYDAEWTLEGLSAKEQEWLVACVTRALETVASRVQATTADAYENAFRALAGL